MERLPLGRYTPEFRAQAVKLIEVEGLSLAEAARRLCVPKNTLRGWVSASRKGSLSTIGQHQKPLNDLEFELARLKKELAETKMERDLLKKAAAYFAKVSR